MDIAVYISELLRDYNEISLSGIGTFCKKKTSAKYDRANGILYPPSEEITFKPGDSGNGELVKYVSRVKNISDAGARYFINKYADHVRQSLTSEGRADLSPLGILLNSDGHLFMSPVPVESSQFGLFPVSDPVFTAPVRKINEPVPATETKYPALMSAEEEKPERSNSLWQAVAVILILVLVAGGLAYVLNPEFFNLRTDQPLQVNKQPARTAAPPALKDTTTQRQDSATNKLVVQPVKKVDSVVQKPAVIASAPVESAPRYDIIGASFGLRSEAEAYIKVMKGRGIQAAILEDTHKPKFKISLGSYTTYEKANQEKRRIQNSFNREAWILTVKDKAKQ